MKLRDPALSNKRIYYYCTAADDRFASNAAVLLGAFMIIWEGKTSMEAYAPWAAARTKFVPFRDPSYWPSDFDVTVADTLDGIYKVRARSAARRCPSRSRPAQPKMTGDVWLDVAGCHAWLGGLSVV